MEKQSGRKHRNESTGEEGLARRAGSLTLVGLGLVVLGTLLALSRLQVIDAGEVISRWWPLVLVAAGIWWIWSGPRLGGWLALGAGVVLLLARLGVIPSQASALVWPLVLVIIGVAVLVTALGAGRGRHGGVGPLPVATFASRQWAGSVAELAGSSVTALFGDARLRLSDGHDASRSDVTDTADEGAATIFVTAIFGDCEIEVPAGWRIRDRVTNVFGTVHAPSGQPDWPEAPVLELRGITVFGDLHIRHHDG